VKAALAAVDAEAERLAQLAIPLQIFLAVLQRGGLLAARHVGICSKVGCSPEEASHRDQATPILDREEFQAAQDYFAAELPEFAPCTACGAKVEKVGTALRFISWDADADQLRRDLRELVVLAGLHAIRVQHERGVSVPGVPS
jgi:hypothetical protein